MIVDNFVRFMKKEKRTKKKTIWLTALFFKLRIFCTVIRYNENINNLTYTIIYISTYINNLIKLYCDTILPIGHFLVYIQCTIILCWSEKVSNHEFVQVLFVHRSLIDHLQYKYLLTIFFTFSLWDTQSFHSKITFAIQTSVWTSQQ